MRLKATTIIIALSSTLLSLASAAAQEAVTDTLYTVEDCLRCHAPGADLAREKIDPLKIYDPSKPHDYRIDPDFFTRSNHGKLVCRICHIVGKEVYPHAATTKGSYFDCAYCHQRDRTDELFRVRNISAEYQASIHVEKKCKDFDCYTCHDPHRFDLNPPDKAVSQIVYDDNMICQSCHDDPSQFEKLTERVFPVILRTHSWLPNVELHWRSIRCVECHTAHSETFTHEILSKERSEKNCIVCHARDSILLTTLYKFQVAEERDRFGFINAVMFGDTYVIGGTRNVWLDRGSFLILVATIMGLGGHASLRIFFAMRRARR